MSRSLVIASALLLTPAAPALGQDGDPALAVFQPTDAAMTCTQMADEAAALSQHMGGRGGRGVIGAVGDAAKAGASLLIPGAGLAMAGVDALTREQRERREAQEAAIENRWYYLNGLYAGRCGAPEVAPAATSSPAQAAPTN